MKKEQIEDTLGSINENLFAIVKLLLDIRHDLIVKETGEATSAFATPQELETRKRAEINSVFATPQEIEARKREARRLYWNDANSDIESQKLFKEKGNK